MKQLRTLTKEDISFIKDTLMPWAGVRKLRLAYSDSKKVWPDVWISFNEIPTITVTNEWKRQDTHERRKRLVHEFLHIRGLEHDEKIGFSTHPDRDSYSMRVYREIIRR